MAKDRLRKSRINFIAKPKMNLFRSNKKHRAKRKIKKIERLIQKQINKNYRDFEHQIKMSEIKSNCIIYKKFY